MVAMGGSGRSTSTAWRRGLQTHDLATRVVLKQEVDPTALVDVDVPNPREILWSPAPNMPAPWTAGRDKPVPYGRCSQHVGAPAPGWKLPWNKLRAGLG